MANPTVVMARRAGAGLFLSLLAAAAGAQTDARLPLERQVDEAFRAMFQNPGDSGNMSRYAQLQLEAGNYEGAIATLERLLVDPATPPSTRVDVAVLYARLKSYSMAESLLNEALQDPRLTGADRQRAESLLADVRSRNQRSQLSGALLAGVRHNTNASFRTDAAAVYAGGVLVPVAPAFRPKSDEDLTLAVRLQHLYDLEMDRYAVVSSTFGATLINQRSSSGSQLRPGFSDPYDLGVVDFSSGVLFSPVRGQDKLTLRPHVLFSQVWAQQHPFVDSAGVGLDLNWRLGDRTFFDSTLDWQRRSYETRPDLANATQLNGHATNLRGRLTQDLGGGQALSGEMALRRYNAQADFQDFRSVEARVAYTLSYAPPMAVGAGNWSTTFTLGALRRQYGAADPAVLAGTSRHDAEWRLGIVQVVPLAPRWTALFQLERVTNNANLPNYDYRNTSVSASVLRAF